MSETLDIEEIAAMVAEVPMANGAPDVAKLQHAIGQLLNENASLTAECDRLRTELSAMEEDAAVMADEIAEVVSVEESIDGETIVAMLERRYRAADEAIVAILRQASARSFTMSDDELRAAHLKALSELVPILPTSPKEPWIR